MKKLLFLIFVLNTTSTFAFYANLKIRVDLKTTWDLPESIFIHNTEITPNQFRCENLKEHKKCFTIADVKVVRLHNVMFDVLGSFNTKKVEFGLTLLCKDGREEPLLDAPLIKRRADGKAYFTMFEILNFEKAYDNCR